MSRRPQTASSSGVWYLLWHLLHLRREHLPDAFDDYSAACYPCNETDSWNNLEDTVGALHLTAHNGPGATTGFCQGGRWPEYDKWFGRGHNAVFNPGTAAPLAVSLWFNPYSLSGNQSLFVKDGEYELLLLPDKLLLRVASNTGGGAWDKEVEVAHSFGTHGWHHALFWIEPGVEIGLCLDGGTPETEALDPGQAARVVSGGVRIGQEVTHSFSSSWHHSSSWHSSSWAFAASSSVGATQYYEGLVDEIAVFNDALGPGWRASLYNGGAGLFWHAAEEEWGPCQGGSSSSWHWSSSYHWSSHQSSSWHHSSWHSSWWSWMEMGAGGAGGGGHAAMSKAAAMPVTGPLLTLAQSAPPERTLCQYVWGARAGHRDELVLRDRDSTGGGGGTLDERLYSLMDYFDPVAVVDREGGVVERYAWTAFGRREVMAPDWAPREGSELDWSFGFHGQFLDGETGYYNYGFRYYVPWLGRWPNRDPIEEQGGLNLYWVANNAATNNVDWLGLLVEWVPLAGTVEQLVRTWLLENYDGFKPYDYMTCSSLPESQCIKCMGDLLSGYGKRYLAPNATRLGIEAALSAIGALRGWGSVAAAATALDALIGLSLTLWAFSKMEEARDEAQEMLCRKNDFGCESLDNSRYVYV